METVTYKTVEFILNLNFHPTKVEVQFCDRYGKQIFKAELDPCLIFDALKSHALLMSKELDNPGLARRGKQLIIADSMADICSKAVWYERRQDESTN